VPPSPTESIGVLRVHLREFYEALDTACGKSMAEDLVAGYRNVGGSNRPSNLTKRLTNALTRIEGYLVEPEETDELPEE
jgi:hypothetical protein